MISSVLSQLGASGADLAAGTVAASVVYLVVIAATRVAGLRSFSKISSYDFAMTVAIGSLIASAASGQARLATVLAGVVVLYTAQFLVAQLRRRGRLGGVLDNSPLLLMDGDQVLHANLAAARVTLDDLHGRLRDANVLRYRDVRAVVLETTGDVSVLHGEGALDPDLLRGVRRA